MRLSVHPKSASPGANSHQLVVPDAENECTDKWMKEWSDIQERRAAIEEWVDAWIRKLVCPAS